MPLLLRLLKSCWHKHSWHPSSSQQMTESSKWCVIFPLLLARIASIDTTKKVTEQFRLRMGGWTDSDQKALETTCFFERKGALDWNFVLRRNGDHFRGDLSLKTLKRTPSGRFPLLNSGLFHKISIALWARDYKHENSLKTSRAD